MTNERQQIDQRRGEIKRARKKKFKRLRNSGQLANYHDSKTRKPVHKEKPIEQPVVAPRLPWWKRLLGRIFSK